MMRRRGFRRAISRAKKRIKHVVKSSLIAYTGNTLTVDTIIQGVDNPVIANAGQIAAGTTVRGFYIEYQIDHSGANVAGAPPSVWDIIFYFSPNTAVNPLPPTYGTGATKQYVFKEAMEMVPRQSSIKRLGYVRIPRKYQRFNNNDSVRMAYQNRIVNTAQDSFCYTIVYKEVK